MGKGIVYVVDDQWEAVEYYSDVLSAEGYQVEKGYSVDDALKYLKDNVPLCVVSDYSMNDSNSIEILEEIAAIDRLRRVGFVMISSKPHSNDLVQRIENLQGKYLSKPVDSELLIKAVEDQIRVHYTN